MNKKKRKVYFTIIIGLLGGLYFFSTMSVFSSNVFFAAQLEERGFIVRANFADCRISVGTEEANEGLLKAIHEILGR